MTRISQLRERLRRTWHRAIHRKAPICDSVKEWAATRPESDYRLLVPSRRITRRLPQTIEPEISTQYLDRQIADQGEKYLVRIDGARILGKNGLIVLPEGAVASESIYNRAILEGDPDYYAPKRRPIIRKSGNYFSLLVIWSRKGIYYHWLHDTLERLFRVMEWLPEDTKYIVPDNLQPYQRETLRLVGIEEHQLTQFCGDEVWDLETLYFSNHTNNSGSHRREADEWLRDNIMRTYRIEPTAPRRRIFISRRAAGSRTLANEQAVEEYLQRFGFETCVPETLSLRDQVKLSAEAETVVSTHGSGLTNILFAPQGLIVVDMIPPSMMHLAYVFWAMSEELSHRYWYFQIEDVLRADHRADTYVPMDKLAATIDRLQLH